MKHYKHSNIYQKAARTIGVYHLNRTVWLHTYTPYLKNGHFGSRNSLNFNLFNSTSSIKNIRMQMQKHQSIIHYEQEK